MGSLNQGRKKAMDPQQVAKVRRLYHKSGVGTTVLATRFGVSQTTIQHAILGHGAYADSGGTLEYPAVDSLIRLTNRA